MKSIVFKILPLNLLLFFCCVNTGKLIASGNDANYSIAFKSGINGHPLNQVAYQKISLTEQFNILKALKINCYRFDVPIDTKGNIVNEVTFYKLRDLAQTYKIILLPMIYMAGLDYNDNELVAYNKGYAIGYNFAKKYGKALNYYELGNEQEIGIAKKGVSGSSPDDYDMSKLKIASSFWKGMINGIKLNNPNAKTIINCGGWFHYVFFDLLDKENVKYNIIGYHWYSSMDDYSKTVKVNILEKLSRFNKLIWFTELNLQDGTSRATEKAQMLWVSNFVKLCRQSRNVQAAFIYELLDEPELQGAPDNEKNYGVIKWKKSAQSKKWDYKLLGLSLNK